MLDEVDDPFDSDKDRDVSEDLFSSSEDKVSKTESFDSSTSQEENGSNSAKENKDVEKTVSSSETKSALTRVGQRFLKNKNQRFCLSNFFLITFLVNKQVFSCFYTVSFSDWNWNIQFYLR